VTEEEGLGLKRQGQGMGGKKPSSFSKGEGAFLKDRSSMTVEKEMGKE